jgi:hypothetical protein
MKDFRPHITIAVVINLVASMTDSELKSEAVYGTIHFIKTGHLASLLLPQMNEVGGRLVMMG